MTLLTEYAPTGKMKQAMYLPAVFSVDAAMAKPTMAIVRPVVMCQVRSWYLPELQPKRMPAHPAKINGGHVMTRVTVVLKPRVLTTLKQGLVNYRRKVWNCSRWKKRVERACRKVEVLHEDEQPSSLVLASLLQAFHSRRLTLSIGHAIAFHSCMSEVLLVLIQPPCR